MKLVPLELNTAKSIQVLEKTLETMVSHNLNREPMLYAVIFYYHQMGDEWPEFKAELEELLSYPQGLSKVQAESLFQRYVVSHSGLFDDLDQAIRNLMGKMIDRINGWTSKLDSDVSDFDQILHRLDHDNPSSDELMALTKKVTDKTRGMLASAGDVTQYIHHTTAEIEQLKQKLNEARLQASQDPLTELANRRMFDAFFVEKMAESQATKAPLSLILLDIDLFKTFNDDYGHLVGDSVLRFVAGIVKKHKRENDLTARYGGEEFAILLPGNNLRVAFAVAERTRKAIEDASLKRSDTGETIRQITASFGVSTLDLSEEDEDSMACMIKRADDALYRSKHCGRNRTSTEDQVGTPCDEPRKII